MSAFINKEPADRQPFLPATAIDSMSMSPAGQDRAYANLSTSNRYDSAYLWTSLLTIILMPCMDLLLHLAIRGEVGL
jgi:hypothetical protein